VNKKILRTIFWILIIILALVLLNYANNTYEEWKKENCDLTFYTYTYNDGCASACSIKCSDEDFDGVSSAYFEPYLSAEDMANATLYKRCECNCEGCRER